MIHVAPGSVRGGLRAPASKSHLQRLILAATLADGESRIHDPGSSADGQACLAVARALGAEVQEEARTLRIRGGLEARTRTLDCGESGFCLRAAASLAALSGQDFTLTGQGSLALRPMDMVLEPLRQLGVRCGTREGRATITVQGPLAGGKAVVDGSSSSQFLSGLLLALPRAAGDSEITVRGLRSAPYVRMTLDVLAAFGVQVDADPALTRFRMRGGQTYQPVDLAVEGDWSGAAFLLVAGAVACEADASLRGRIILANKRFSVHGVVEPPARRPPGHLPALSRPPRRGDDTRPSRARRCLTWASFAILLVVVMYR